MLQIFKNVLVNYLLNRNYDYYSELFQRVNNQLYIICWSKDDDSCFGLSCLSAQAYL